MEEKMILKWGRRNLEFQRQGLLLNTERWSAELREMRVTVVRLKPTMRWFGRCSYAPEDWNGASGPHPQDALDHVYTWLRLHVKEMHEELEEMKGTLDCGALFSTAYSNRIESRW